MKWTFPRGAGLNVLLSIVSIILAAGVFELYFRYFHVQTTGFDVTLSNQKWLETYWNPVNSFGFRDREYSPETLQGKKIAFVLGDSFTAGVGIKDIRDRFSDILGRQLGDRFAVLNIAQRGWSTYEERLALDEMPLRPDIVILGYYINDIEGAAAAYDVRSTDAGAVYEAYADPGIFHAVRRRSYLIDFLFWRLYPLSLESHAGWRNWIRGLYEDPLIWEAHAAELGSIIDSCARSQAKLYVVVFPSLVDIRGSAEMTSKVAEYFAQRNIPVLDLAVSLEDAPTSELVVNNADAHPGMFVHQFVGTALAERIRTDFGGPHRRDR